MACSNVLVLFAAAAASPLAASQPQQIGAPAAPPSARYCLRVDPVIGSNMETIRCETRETWTSLGVDVDKEWTAWGVRVVTGMPNG